MMANKKKMDDYNWPDLYRQADEFMRQYIPETLIHTRVRSLFDGRPAVTVHFPAKGHKQELDLFTHILYFVDLFFYVQYAFLEYNLPNIPKFFFLSLLHDQNQAHQ